MAAKEMLVRNAYLTIGVFAILGGIGSVILLIGLITKVSAWFALALPVAVYLIVLAVEWATEPR